MPATDEGLPALFFRKHLPRLVSTVGSRPNTASLQPGVVVQAAAQLMPLGLSNIVMSLNG